MSPSVRDDPIGGIVAMCAAMACFIVSDVFTKLAAEQLPIGQVITLRGLISATIFFVPAAGSLGLIRSRWSKPWVARVLGEMGGSLTFISAIAVLPIANVVSISQTSVIVMTLAGALLLGERVGVRRWIATLAGFAGVLLIVKPGAADFAWWSVLPVLTMLCMVVRDLATRTMARDIPSVLITFTTALAVIVGGVLLSLVEGGWRVPSWTAWAHLAGGALFVAVAYYFTIESVRKAALSVVAPFRYTILPLSLIAGWLVWSDVPDRYAMVGMAIIAAAGVSTFIMERRGR